MRVKRLQDGQQAIVGTSCEDEDAEILLIEAGRTSLLFVGEVLFRRADVEKLIDHLWYWLAQGCFPEQGQEGEG